jgi:hypothetical protein
MEGVQLPCDEDNKGVHMTSFSSIVNLVRKDCFL